MKTIDTDLITEGGISVIVPTYNGSSWLPKTIEKIRHSLQNAGIKKFEIIIVDDGSTDDTRVVVAKLRRIESNNLNIVSQKNSGRFVARMTGTNKAKYNYLLFVDTRVFIGEGSISLILKEYSKEPNRNVWCSHVRVEKVGNIYARFWEAITFVAWYKYFKNPRDVSYGLEDFDAYPKGTTCFFIKKDILKKANAWFIKNTKDLKVSNDDTLLLRHIAEHNSININPGFWCTYHARSTLPQYSKHVFHRGKVFVDGFLRNDGNKYYWPLVFFLVVTALAPFIFIANQNLIMPAFVIGSILWITELPLFLLIKMPAKDAFSMFILTPIFAVFYAAGIWQAVINIYGFKRVAR